MKNIKERYNYSQNTKTKKLKSNISTRIKSIVTLSKNEITDIANKSITKSNNENESEHIDEHVKDLTERELTLGSHGIKSKSNLYIKTKKSVEAQKASRISTDAMKKSAKVSKKTIKKSIKAGEETAKISAKAAKETSKGISTLVSAVASGGTASLIVILVLFMVIFVIACAFKISDNAESNGGSILLYNTIEQINSEYDKKIEKIKEENEYDDIEYVSSNNVIGINWEDVLAVFSVKTSLGTNAERLSGLREEDREKLSKIVWDMNILSSYILEKDEIIEGETVLRNILYINIEHRSAEDMIEIYSLNQDETDLLRVLCTSEMKEMWGSLMGGYVKGVNDILINSNEIIPTGDLFWPLESSGTITSLYGYRSDPISGEISYHSGLDIAEVEESPILAPADGTVIYANSTDKWGTGYGYYIKIEHSGELVTLFAHCKSICVISGQKVVKGQVIGYVGSTGRSTGPHLHYEVYKKGERIDPLSLFK